MDNVDHLAPGLVSMALVPALAGLHNRWRRTRYQQRQPGLKGGLVLKGRPFCPGCECRAFLSGLRRSVVRARYWTDGCIRLWCKWGKVGHVPGLHLLRPVPLKGSLLPTSLAGG